VEVLHGGSLQSVRTIVETSAGRLYATSGALSDALIPTRWSQKGSAEGFVIYKAHYTPESVWLETAPMQSRASEPGDPTAGGRRLPKKSPSPPRLGTASVVSSATNSAEIKANTVRPSLLVWNTAWDAGWHAEIVAPGGDVSLKIERVGLVQGVVIPPGASLVKFWYKPVGFVEGLAISAATIVVLGVACAVALVHRRRRSRASSTALV
jgi:hypothetical protein